MNGISSSSRFGLSTRSRISGRLCCDGKANSTSDCEGSARLAGVVFLFDNHLSGTAGLIFLASIAVLARCGIVWMIFLHEEDGEDGSGYWPPRPLP